MPNSEPRSNPTALTLSAFARRTVLVCCLLTLPAFSLSAHDFWIEPSNFFPGQKEQVTIRLRVGENFLGDPVPRNVPQIARFVAASKAGEVAVQGTHGADPAGSVRIAASGLTQIGYRSQPQPVQLPAAQFESYLREEGLEAVIAERAARKEGQKSGREVFSRHAKSLLQTGAATKTTLPALGLALELQPDVNPYSIAPGGQLPLRVLFMGKPLAGALVVAIPKTRPGARVSGRTDLNGRVVLPLQRGGTWLVKSVHMKRVSRPDADWESLWASLTFRLAEKTGGVKKR